MKRILILLVAVLLMAGSVWGQDIVEPEEYAPYEPWITYYDYPQQDIKVSAGWGVGLMTSVPLIKITESLEDASKLDAIPIVGLGGGLSWYYTNDKMAPDHERMVSIGFPYIILTTRLDGNEGMFDPSLGVVVGAMDDVVQLGWMYFCGARDPERSRHEFVFSLGFRL